MSVPSLLAVLALMSTAAGCPLGTSIGPDDAGPQDAGPVVISCVAAEDCPQDQPECSFGVCKRPCAANDGCIDPNTFCNATSGYCEFGCRDSSTCTDGKVCSGGSCIESQGCATKCDCAVGQVCAGGACQDPPAQCASSDDCGKAPGDQCEDFACNGFTKLCFDPDPEPCADDGDCDGRPGCAGGCTCTGNNQCVPEVACTEQNESSTCGAGNYCDGNGTCQVLPACTTEAQCSPLGLTCSIGQGQCLRARPCTANGDCTSSPPTTYCDLDIGFCAQPLCSNGGITCDADENCAADGRCVTGSGGACTNDTQCAATEYCAVVGGQGQCAVGCRNNSSCDPGQQCDATRTCVGGGQALGFGETCAADEDCQVGLICGTATFTCAEPCDSPGSQCAGGSCCPLSGAGCCNAIFIFGFCGDC